MQLHHAKRTLHQKDVFVWFRICSEAKPLPLCTLNGGCGSVLVMEPCIPMAYACNNAAV